VNEAQSILADRQHLLVEEEGKFMFRHQFFRDFLSAAHISDSLAAALSGDVFALPKEISERALPAYVAGMLGDYYKENQNQNGFCHRTPLHDLMEHLSGLKNENIGCALLNVMNIWRIARNGVIAGEVLKGHDFTNITLNGARFYNAGVTTRFIDCDLAGTTLLTPWHTAVEPRRDSHRLETRVCTPVYSPDGRCVLVSSSDDCVLEWDLQSRMCQRVFEGHKSHINSVAYSPDGKSVFSSTAGGCIREWDRVTGVCVKSRAITPVTSVNSLNISENGLFILCGLGDGRVIEVDRETGKYDVYEGHKSAVCSAIYSGDGQFILTSSEDYSAREWEWSSKQCVTVFSGHSGPLRSAAYSPDGKRILTLSTDKTVREWEKGSGKQLHKYWGYSWGVQAAFYSMSGKSFIAVSDSGVIERDCESGAVIRIFDSSVAKAARAVYNSKLERVLMISGGDIYEVDYKSRAVIHVIEQTEDHFRRVKYCPEGDFVLVSQGEQWKRWELGSDLYKPHFTDTINRSLFKIYVISMNGKRALVKAVDDGRLYELDTERNEVNIEFDSGDVEIKCVCYSPDENYVLCVHLCGWVEWERATGKRTTVFSDSLWDDQTDASKIAVYSPDSNRIAMVCIDNNDNEILIVKEWSREAGESRVLHKSKSALKISGYSPDSGQILLYGDGCIIIDTSKRSYRKYAVKGVIRKAVFSADGSHIIACDRDIDYSISIYDCETGECTAIRKYNNIYHGSLVAMAGTRFLHIYENIMEELDYKKRKPIKRLAAHSGVLIDGCEFIVCRFGHPELEHTIHQYGGLVSSQDGR